jgi:hypothetical protein
LWGTTTAVVVGVGVVSGSVDGGGGVVVVVVVVVPFWGLASRAFVVLRMAVDVALACHVSGLVVAPFVGHHHRRCCECGRRRRRCVGCGWSVRVVVVYGGGGEKRGVVHC